MDHTAVAPRSVLNDNRLRQTETNAGQEKLAGLDTAREIKTARASDKHKIQKQGTLSLASITLLK